MDIDGSIHSIEQWVKNLPSSRMVFPNEMVNRIKYFAWRVYTPLHPYFRDALLGLRILHHQGRQDFLLGRIAPGQTLREFVSHCIERGYGNHFVAWHDEGEVVSLRYVDDFAYQYHLRIFRDGEVRGHFEYTPEYRPIAHMRDVGCEDRRHIFYEHLGDRIVRTFEPQS